MKRLLLLVVMAALAAVGILYGLRRAERTPHATVTVLLPRGTVSVTAVAPVGSVTVEVSGVIARVVDWVGTATPTWAVYMIRTCLRPGLTGGFAWVTCSRNLLSAGVGTRVRRKFGIEG